MGGWGEYLAAFAAFLASHAIPARPELKAQIVGILGQRGYVAGFSLLSTLLLFWLIFAAGRAPFVALWDPAGWHRWAVNLAMPLAVLLGTFAIGTINPFSFGGRAAGFDPDHPGIAGVTRHPLLWALLIWAGAHLLVNGDLAHAILFAVFFAFSVLGMVLIDRRNRRLWGPAEFARLTARTGTLPFAALLSGRWRPTSAPSVSRLILAGLIWAALLLLHPPVIGMSPLP